MTAPSEFGAAIPTNGVRLPWLRDDVRVLPCWDGTWSEIREFTAHDIMAWHRCTALKLERPRYDSVYLALERGFVPWLGGDEAPGDWDASKSVLLRNGFQVDGVYRWSIGYPAEANKDATGPISTDVIGYHQKPTSTALSLPQPAADVGTVARLQDDIRALFEAEGSARCDECGAPLFDHDKTTTDADELVALCAGHCEPDQPIYSYRTAQPAAVEDTLRRFQQAWDAQPDLPPCDFTRAEAEALAAALAPAAIASGREGAA